MKRGEGADWFSWWAQGDDVSSDHAGLTPEERELVKRYKGENYTLTASPSPEGPKYTVTNFIHGVSQEMKEITILLKNEEEIKSACRNFKTLLNVMATFSGEEVVEF